MKKESNHQIHPEGFTSNLEQLANLLLKTKTFGKVRRREQLSGDGYKLIESSRYTNLIDFDPQEGEFAFKLHELHPELPLAPNYINWRNVPEDVIDIIGRNLAEVKLKNKPKLCTGIPNAGTDLAKYYAEYSSIPYVELFIKEKTENGERIVLKDHKIYGYGNILVIDNVITKGTSFFEVMKLFKALPDSVELLVGIDREEGGSEEMMRQGYKFSCLYKFSKLLDYYLRTDESRKEKYI